MKKVFLVVKKTELPYGNEVKTTFYACTTKKAATLTIKSMKLLFGEPAENEKWLIEETELVNGIEAENTFYYRKEKAHL